MAKHDEIAKIYDQKLSQLRDPAEWKNTLRLTSNFWRLDFCAAMLLVVQNPQAQMCGTLAQWNNVGRYVRRGEHSTVVFHERTDTQLLYLFDVRQTYGTPYNAKWKLTDKNGNQQTWYEIVADRISFTGEKSQGGSYNDYAASAPSAPAPQAPAPAAPAQQSPAVDFATAPTDDYPF